MKHFTKRIMPLVLAFVLAMTGSVSIGMEVKAEGTSNSAPSKLILNSKNASTYVGGSVKIKVSEVEPGDASKSVTYVSSNKRVATVSAAGVVKGKKTGTVIVKVQSKKNSKVYTKCRVKIYSATRKLVLKSKNEYTLNVGKTVILKASVEKSENGYQPIQWTSKDENIAEVSSSGKVTAVAAGETTIIGKSGNKSVKVKILVKDSTKKEDSSQTDDSKKDNDSSSQSDEGNSAQTTDTDITSTTVHITDTGTKYHRAGCSSLSKSDYEISLQDAKNAGYTPCSKCDPPQ